MVKKQKQRALVRDEQIVKRMKMCLEKNGDVERDSDNVTGKCIPIDKDIDDSRLAIGVQKFGIIRLSLCTDSTLIFALRIAYPLAA